MSKTPKKFFFFLSTLIIFFIGELLYLQIFHSIDPEAKKQKRAFVTLVGLPDLAISTEADYIRHRSLSTYFSLFKEGPLMREYYRTTYLYQPSNTYFTEHSNER